MKKVLLVLYLFPVFLDGANVCQTSTNNTNWPYSTDSGSSYSCVSSGGATNDLGTTPTQCEGDPTSVRIEVTRGLAECLVAKASECKIPMHDFISLDYDFEIDQCMGIWAAPLWMTPDTWQWDGGSGEIDSLEFCARDAIHLNFAGGGHQVELDPSQFNIDDASGHVTVRKDDAGIITIVACSKEEASESGQCLAPSYSGCDDCLGNSDSYGCWCNEPDNIYGSGGCQSDTDCMWTLVSDIWNGVDGDAGYYGCMTEVSDIGLDSGVPNYNSNCSLSVEQVVLRGGGSNESLRWGEGSPDSCSVFTPSPDTVNDRH